MSTQPFPDPVYTLARRLRPDLENLSPLDRLGRVTDILGAVTVAPLCLAGLAWLAAVTDLNLVAHHWPMLMLIGVIMFALDRLSFVVIANLGSAGDAYSNIQTTLVNLAKWSAVFIFGPTALWLNVLLILASTFADRPDLRSRDQRWHLAHDLLIALTHSSFFPLLALVLYRNWGGTFPPQEVSLRLFLLGAVVGLVELVLEIGLLWANYLGYSLWFMRKLGLLKRQAALSIASLLGLGVGIPYLSGLFAILLAGLYAQHGAAVYLIFVLAAGLVALMGRRLGQAMEDSRQQSLQLHKLETMGRAILNAAPDDETALPVILAQNAPSMFTWSRLAIWLAPERVLFKRPEEWGQVDLASIQAWVAGENQARAFTARQSLPWLPEQAKPDHPPLLAAPVLDAESGQPCGGVYVELISMGRTWDARTLAGLLPTLQTLAAQVSAALHQQRVYQRTLAHQKTQQELALARGIQASFLPKVLPEIPGWGLAASLEPARQMSGDFYDLIPLEEGKLGLLIADVTDKGVGPAMFMALSRTLIRTFARQYPEQPELVLQAANHRILQDVGSPLFVTTFYGVLDPQTGRLVYANAGHNPPLLFHAGQTEPQLLKATGMPLAVDETMQWGQATAQLNPEDVLFLYTDGATDAQNEQEEFFSFERLTESVAAVANLPAAELHTSLVAELRQFIGAVPQFDDITLMVVKNTTLPATLP